MKLRIDVSFEYLNRPAESFKTTIEATGPATCVARAIKQAQKALRPRNWSTMVAVVLERLDASEASEAETDDSDAADDSAPETGAAYG